MIEYLIPACKNWLKKYSLYKSEIKILVTIKNQKLDLHSEGIGLGWNVENSVNKKLNLI